METVDAWFSVHLPATIAVDRRPLLLTIAVHWCPSPFIAGNRRQGMAVTLSKMYGNDDDNAQQSTGIAGRGTEQKTTMSA